MVQKELTFAMPLIVTMANTCNEHVTFVLKWNEKHIYFKRNSFILIMYKNMFR